jgi:hypothetical protein
VPRDPKSDVLQLQLSRYHSLDVVRLPKSRKYRVVFAERFGVQRRAFVEISFEEAHRLALFLASVDDHLRPQTDDDPPTDPSRPSKLPPAEVVDMEVERLERDAVPEALPPIPQIPRVPTRERMRAVTSPDAVVKEFADDPRTGVVPLEYQDTAVKDPEEPDPD